MKIGIFIYFKEYKGNMRKIIVFSIIGAVILAAAIFADYSGIGNISGYVVLDMENKDTAIEINSPHDRIKEDQIKVYKNLIIMHISDSELILVSDTNSMDPLIDNGSEVIQIKPEEDNIHIGDIVSYENKNLNKTFLHRIVSIGEDDNGKYYILKGDNADSADPGKVRFSQIRGVVVGIIY